MGASTTTSWACVILGCALGACPKPHHDEAPKPAPSAIGGGALRSVHATFGDRKLDFPYGRAFPRLGGVHLVLSTKPTSCAAPRALDDAGSIELDVPPGPKGDFFAGAPIGVEAWFHDPERSTTQGRAAPWQTTLKLDARPGAHVAGTIDFAARIDGADDRASGAFDVELCDRDAPHLEAGAAPSVDADGPVSGSLAGDAFTAGSAIAEVWRDPSTGEAFVHALSFFPSSGVDCATRFAHERRERVILFEEMGGVSERRTLPGPQPATAFVSAPEVDPASSGDAGAAPTLQALGAAGHAWVRLDDPHVDAAKQGDRLRGSVAAASEVGAPAKSTGHLGGTFDALVCTH